MVASTYVYIYTCFYLKDGIEYFERKKPFEEGFVFVKLIEPIFEDREE